MRGPSFAAGLVLLALGGVTLVSLPPLLYAACATGLLTAHGQCAPGSAIAAAAVVPLLATVAGLVLVVRSR
jgi:hypothetical protein